MRMGTPIDDYIGITVFLAINPLGGRQLAARRFLASHANSATFLTVLDQEIETTQRVKTDPSERSLFEESDLESLHEMRDYATSNPDSSVRLTILDAVLAGMLDVLHNPAHATTHSEIESALASIGAVASSDLCELITTDGGPFARKVLAISVLRKIYAYVPATTQTTIESAVDTASQQATTSKKLVAALSAAKTALKAAPASTTVAPAESTAPHLLDATSAI
jgi:hypothetical protein